MLVTYQNYTKVHSQKNKKNVLHIGHLPELYEGAQSEK